MKQQDYTEHKEQTFPVVEMFYSIQGEGRYTGRPSIFIRFFGCNFECNGFSNTDEEGNIGDIEIRQVDSIDQLSNNDFTKGCDSRYSWHKDYEHLAKRLTAHEIALQCKRLLADYNHKLDFTEVDIIFTGGEPLMNQTAIIETCKAIVAIDNDLNTFMGEGHVTIETNASVSPKSELIQFFNHELPEVEVLWSCSPKLSISGEPRSKAWAPKVLQRMQKVDNCLITFKFVVGTESDVNEAMDYIEECAVEALDGEFQGIYLMPVGATAEQQMETMPFVAEQCMRTGAQLSARMHVFAFGNELGT